MRASVKASGDHAAWREVPTRRFPPCRLGQVAMEPVRRRAHADGQLSAVPAGHDPPL